MGQRLVINCIRDGEKFATLYFHWSAYTDSTYEEGRKIVSGLMERGYSKDMTKEETILMLEKILREDSHGLDYFNKTITHGGVDQTDAEIAAFEALGLSKEEMDAENISRSEGLISITEQGMRDSETWGEGFAVLDFDNETFENDIFYEEEPNSEAFEFDDFTYDTLPKWDPPMEFTGAIKWENVEAARDWYWENYGKDCRYILGKLNNGNILVSVT